LIEEVPQVELVALAPEGFTAMTPLLATLLLAPAAPVPKPPPPNRYAYAYLGVRMKTSANRLVIEAPEPGTPSQKAGLRDGDELLQLGTLRPTRFEQLTEYVIDLRPGTDIYIEVRRGGAVVSTRLVLGVRPDTPEYDPRDIFLRRQGVILFDDR
jgi:predicted metalloprotease with PDZ domain